ncbi:hypothetical protein F5X99DRAFT_380241 [Biscogniauxia marginata]|nr:hypothetical protein F5X99DRAFT_380241 [Biscogniauxia marginata]
MDVEHVLDIPRGELAFLYPSDAPADRFDSRFKALRVERRGLREWDSFEENPAYLQKFMKRPTGHPTSWRPSIFPWTRYAGSETNVVDLLKSSLILRLNIALDTIFSGVSIIGTPKHFPSYGTDDNRFEGGPEVHIGPDLPVLDGDARFSPALQELQNKVITFGDAKVKNPGLTRDKSRLLPGTLGCYESWLAQAVQCCIDLDIPICWLQTNIEVVFIHLSRSHDYMFQNDNVTTRSSRGVSFKLEALPSDATQEPEYSSPPVRQTHDWLNFNDGDAEVPLISKSDLQKQQCATPMGSSYQNVPSSPTPLQSSPLDRKRARETTPEELNSSQQTVYPPPTPSPDPRTTHDNVSVGDFPFSSSQIGTISPSIFHSDIRAEDVSHVFIKSYPLNDRDVGKRLLELIMLAKRARDLGVLKINPWKLSHSALDALKASS